jgi:hypothetical protein
MLDVEFVIAGQQLANLILLACRHLLHGRCVHDLPKVTLLVLVVRAVAYEWVPEYWKGALRHILRHLTVRLGQLHSQILLINLSLASVGKCQAFLQPFGQLLRVHIIPDLLWRGLLDDNFVS